MIPDFVLYVDPISAVTFELLFVEVKRKENFQNNYLENDVVKLGKEMHTALNKLALKKVKSLKIVSILVEGKLVLKDHARSKYLLTGFILDHKAVCYSMDLAYNGQYRMVEISSFFFNRDTTDDILLIPTIIEKLNHQVKVSNIIYHEQKRKNLYYLIRKSSTIQFQMNILPLTMMIKTRKKKKIKQHLLEMLLKDQYQLTLRSCKGKEGGDFTSYLLNDQYLWK
jgi:hypothetical protein